MKLIFFNIFILISIYFPVIGQKTCFPKGAYFTLEELQTRNPSFHSDFIIESRTKGVQKAWGGNDFAFTSSNNAIDKAVIRNKIYAISNGENLFLNGKMVNGQQWYTQVLSEGKYLLFTASAPRDQNSQAWIRGFTMGMVGIASAVYTENSNAAGIKFLFVMEYDTGKIFLVTKKFIEEILKDYSDLKDKFESEPDNWSKEVLGKYIDLVNKS